LAFAYALLILTHLPTALLFSFFLILYAAILSVQKRYLNLIFKVALGSLIGVLLSSIYLVPALFSQGYIHSAYLWSGYYEYSRWFFLDGQAEPNKPFGNRLFEVLAVSTLLLGALTVVFLASHQKSRTQRIIPWLSFTVLTWYLICPLSKPLWVMLPILQKVQFPFRAAIMLDVATAMVAGYALWSFQRGRTLLSKTALATASVLLLYLWVTGAWQARGTAFRYTGIEDIKQRNARLISSRDAVEYLPAWVRMSRNELLPILAQSDKLRLDPNEGSAVVVKWISRRIDVDLNLPQETQLTIRQFYYPGWSSELDGRAVNLSLKATDQTGLLNLNAPAGTYRLSLRLKALWQEILGIILSCFGLAVVLIVTISRIRRHDSQAPYDALYRRST